MKFTRIPETTFKNIQLNAGILVRNFDPDTQVIAGLMGATTGGINFTATPSFEDFGDDIDNCPKNTMELKKITSWDVNLSGTFVTMTAETAKTLVGAADSDAVDATKIIPRKDVLLTDYEDLWWIGDYSDVNTGDNAGFCAIHMLNSLNTGGFQIQSNDKGKGNFAFTFTGHVSMDAQDVVPFELYIREGNTFTTPSVRAEAGTVIVFGKSVSELQKDIVLSDSDIEGTLHYVTGYTEFSGDPELQEGNFLALKFTSSDWTQYTSVKVGLDPSEGSGLVEILNDPDKNGVFRIVSTSQVFKIVATGAAGTVTHTYDLSKLVLEPNA